MNQPPVDYIERTREQYSALGYPVYRWLEETEPPAFTRVDKPMHEWRVGLVASGGIYVQGQIAFHHRDDVSYREIDGDTAVERLRATHFAYDLADARADPNVVFPLPKRCVTCATPARSARSRPAPTRSWAASTPCARSGTSSLRHWPNASFRTASTSRSWCRSDPSAISPSD